MPLTTKNNLPFTVLTLSWSVSRGRDTYGYNICRLDDEASGQRYKCNGGGYDMIGTVLGQWVQDVLQPELLAISKRARVDYTFPPAVDGKAQPRVRRENEKGLYGLSRLHGLDYSPEERRKRAKAGRSIEYPIMQIDGACGRNSVERIIEACGYQIETRVNKKGRCVGWFISPKKGEA